MKLLVTDEKIPDLYSFKAEILVNMPESLWNFEIKCDYVDAEQNNSLLQQLWETTRLLNIGQVESLFERL